MVGRRRIMAIGLAVAIVVAGVVGVRLWRDAHRTAFASAVRHVPAETLRLSFTDWAAVRKTLGFEGRSATPAMLDELLEAAYEADLSAVSTIDSAAPALQRYYGLSPASISWEAYAQSRAGAVLVMELPDGGAVDAVAGQLEKTGFPRPSAADGLWVGGPDLVGGLDSTITPELQYVILLRGQHLVVTSDSPEYAEKAARVARTGKDALNDVDRVSDLVNISGDPAAAAMWTRDFACEDLSDANESPDTRERWAQLVEQAGKVTPVNGVVMGMAADRSLRVGLAFETSAQAKANLPARVALARGEVPGRGESLADRFTLTSSGVSGPVVTLVLKPTPDTRYSLSGLNRGPVIFAAC